MNIHLHTGLPVRAALLLALVTACQPAAMTPTSTPAGVPTAPAATSTPAATPTTAATVAPTVAAPTATAAASTTLAFAQFVATPGSTPPVMGGATLFAVEGQTQVVIGVLQPGTEPIAASIQEGTCGDLNPLIAYPLTEVTSGASTTPVDVELSTLLATDHAINLSVFGSETESSLACGNIEAAALPLP